MKELTVQARRPVKQHRIRTPGKGIIFDLDGVIIDSEHLMRLALKHAYNQTVSSGEPPYDEYFKHMGDFFPVIMKKMGLPVTMWEPYKAYSIQHLDQVKIFPGIIDQLQWLSEFKQLQLGIVTGKDKKRTLHLLQHFGIDKYFEIVVTPEMVERAKPHPDGLLYAAQYLKCEIENSLYIGDALNDLVAANSAGMTAVMAAWGAKVKVAEMKELSDFIIEQPSAIRPFIEQHYL